ncbi:MAG: efflux RND transporter periplasmic adaptor subunit [Balneola sp.]|jgi:membrane fusion protein (multidrug efflux system)
MKVQNYLTILIAGTVLLGCGGEAQQAETQEELVKTVNITTKTLVPSTFASYVRVVGNVETSNDIMISAEVNGRVIDYRVEEGAQVKKGQTIVKIDDSKLKQEKARLEAMTSQTKEQYERLKKVYEEDGIGSELDYLNAKYAYEQSNSALESIKIDLENTSIKAPFNGEVEAIIVEEGEMVSPGMQVIRLIGSDAYKIVAGVPARYSDAVQIGDKVDVWFDTQVRDTLNSAINYVGGSINPQNRTFRIETRLPKNKTYKVDMIANMKLKTVEQSNVLVISEEFVYSKDNRYVVYVLSENEEGKAVANEREVKLGLSYQTNVIIEEGLTQGDKLITLGSAFLDDGMRVTVKDDKKLAVN